MPKPHRQGYVMDQMKLLGGTDYLGNQAIYDFYAIMGEINGKLGANHFDIKGLFATTLLYLDRHIDTFYRHAALALLEVPAGKAFSSKYDRMAFSMGANKAFIASSFRYIDGKMKIILDQESPDFEIKKALVLLVDESDFHMNGMSSEELYTLYRVTGFKCLLPGMNAEDLTQTLEADLGL
jgi:hypothetical protein